MTIPSLERGNSVKTDTAVNLHPDIRLAMDIAQFVDDPEGFAKYAFPWGEGQLSYARSLRRWQRRYLRKLGELVRARGFNGIEPVLPIQISTSSGHGIGKSALTAILILWIMSTRPFAKGVITSNTSDQLRTKTWGELAKWKKLCITGHWFVYNNSKGNMNLYHRDHKDSWRCDAQTCEERNSESFAGLHAANSTPFYIFDEASAVPDSIYEVANGGLTDGEPMIFLFGNPTRNTGRFRETFGRLRHRWENFQIDSREVEGTNKELFKQWIEDFGEDSDFVKVRVRGLFPNASSLQFIPSDVIERCANMNDPVMSIHDPLIVSVDVARFGDDESVIRFRKGRNARIFPAQSFREMSTMQLAARVAEIARGSHYTNGERPDAIFIDGGGVGGGVIDRLRELGVEVIEVNGGNKATGQQCANMRAQMWWNAREAMIEGIAIDPNDHVLMDQLASQEYGYNIMTKILLVKKEDMKKMGLASPDHADAFVMSFAYPVFKQSRELYDTMQAVQDHASIYDDDDPYA